MNRPTHERAPANRRGRTVAVLLVGVAVATIASAGVATAAPAGPVRTAPTGAVRVLADPPTIPQPIPPPPTGPVPTETPGTPNPVPPVPAAGSDDPGMFDIPGQVRKAMGDFFGGLAKSGLDPMLKILGQTVLATPQVTGNDRVQVVWTTCLVAANAIFVLLIVAACFIIASKDTLQARYGLKEMLPRLVVAAIASNCSLLVAGKAIEAANALTGALFGQGIDGPAAGAAISEAVTNLAVGGNTILWSLLQIAVLVMTIVVVMTFFLRATALVILIAVAPLALMCHALPQTEGLAYMWWRALAGCLGVQIAQSIVLLAAVRMFLTPTGLSLLGFSNSTDSIGQGLLSVLMAVAMLSLLIKIPGWTKQMVFGPAKGKGLVGTVIRTIIMIKTLGAVSGLTKSAAAGARGAATVRTGAPVARAAQSMPASRVPARPARPLPAAPRPAPVGPAAFSHAPAAQAPLPGPVGTAAPASFSNAPVPDQPVPPPPLGYRVNPRFSAATPPPVPLKAPAIKPAPVAFTPPATPAPARPASGPAVPVRPVPKPSGPAPAPAFSAAPKPQVAPKRPPAPVTPVFSSPPPTPPAAARPRPKPAPPAGRPASTRKKEA